MADQATINGTIGRFLVGPLKDAVEYSRFKGYSVDLYVGRGLMQKPFEVKGDKFAVQMIQEWLSEIGGT